MNLINSQQGIINTWHKELIARMRAIPTYVQIEGLHDAKKSLENAWFFFNSNTQTAWNRFKSHIPFTLQHRLKNIYFERAEDVKSKLVILDRKITELEQKPKSVPRRTTSPELPTYFSSLFAQKPAQKKQSIFSNTYVTRVTIS